MNDPTVNQQAVDAMCLLLRTQPQATDIQRTLQRHLRPGEAEYWEGMSVDLSGATLVDADFSGCHLSAARFADTRFQGETSFAGAQFEDVPLFWRALFEGDATFAGARFADGAAFGRARFHGDADFEDARFGGIAWFGRGEESLADDDPLWEAMEDGGTDRLLPWDELNESDPGWPSAVLEEDYQEWTEGGDGARFNGRASFQRARFDDAAWFWKARFGGAAAFGSASFAGLVHLDQPTVDLTGARAARPDDEDDAQNWPFGWTSAPESEDPSQSQSRLVPDESVQPYTRQLADADGEVRLSGLHILQTLGDATPELRQRIADAICEYLRIPLAFDVTAEAAARTADQAQELEIRRVAQRILAEHLRPRPVAGDEPAPGPDSQFWDDVRLQLSGATLIDFDLADCHLEYGDFSGAQFHGATSFAGSSFSQSALFCLHGGGGSAVFHGGTTFAGAQLTGEWGFACCALHANMA